MARKKGSKRVDLSRVSWALADLRRAAKKSDSYYKVAENLGLVNSGGNAITVKKYMRKCGVSLRG